MVFMACVRVTRAMGQLRVIKLAGLASWVAGAVGEDLARAVDCSGPVPPRSKAWDIGLGSPSAFGPSLPWSVRVPMAEAPRVEADFGARSND
mgnify:FL=1